MRGERVQGKSAKRLCNFGIRSGSERVQVGSDGAAAPNRRGFGFCGYVPYAPSQPPATTSRNCYWPGESDCIIKT